MTAPRRATQSARAWRRDRMIERRAARLLEDGAAQTAVRARAGAVELLAMPLTSLTNLAGTRHALVAPEASLLGRPGRWVV